MRTIFIDMTFIFSVLYYVKYRQIDIKLAANHLGKVCAMLSVLAYGAPLASLVSTKFSIGVFSFFYISLLLLNTTFIIMYILAVSYTTHHVFANFHTCFVQCSWRGPSWLCFYVSWRGPSWL